MPAAGEKSSRIKAGDAFLGFSHGAGAGALGGGDSRVIAAG